MWCGQIEINHITAESTSSIWLQCIYLYRWMHLDVSSVGDNHVNGSNQICPISASNTSTVRSVVNPMRISSDNLYPNVRFLSIPKLNVPLLSNVPSSFDRSGDINGYGAVRRTPFHVSGDLIWSVFAISVLLIIFQIRIFDKILYIFRYSLSSIIGILQRNISFSDPSISSHPAASTCYINRIDLKHVFYLIGWFISNLK